MHVCTSNNETNIWQMKTHLCTRSVKLPSQPPPPPDGKGGRTARRGLCRAVQLRGVGVAEQRPPAVAGGVVLREVAARPEGPQHPLGPLVDLPDRVQVPAAGEGGRWRQSLWPLATQTGPGQKRS